LQIPALVFFVYFHRVHRFPLLPRAARPAKFFAQVNALGARTGRPSFELTRPSVRSCRRRVASALCAPPSWGSTRFPRHRLRRRAIWHRQPHDRWPRLCPHLAQRPHALLHDRRRAHPPSPLKALHKPPKRHVQDEREAHAGLAQLPRPAQQKAELAEPEFSKEAWDELASDLRHIEMERTWARPEPGDPNCRMPRQT
jgi:hypothetical protein